MVFFSLSVECVGVGVCLLRGCVYSFSMKAKNVTEHGQSETSVGEGGGASCVGANRVCL